MYFKDSDTAEIIDAKKRAWDDVNAAFSMEVADSYLATMQLFLENSTTKSLDDVAVALLICKSILSTYVGKTYPTNEQEAPPDLRNLLYYVEQCQASLAQQYLEARMEGRQGILL
jgi:hypothetical protein